MKRVRRSKRRLGVPSVLAATVAFAAVASGASRAADVPRATATAGAVLAPVQPSDARSGPRVGVRAPDFTLRALDGRRVGLASYRGKTLVINAWATWCPPCRLEMPDLIAAARLAKGDVAFLGVDTTEAEPLVRAYAVAKDVPYALAASSDGAFERAYDVQYFPTTYVVDRAGIVRAIYTDVLDRKELATLVAAADAERDATIASPLQTKIDATLAPAGFSFAGDPATFEATAKRADAAIATAEDLLGDTDASANRATDFTHTRAEEATLRDAAIAALVDVGTSVRDPKLLTRMRGDAARDGERWTDAAQSYTAVLALDPHDADALAGLERAAGRLKETALRVAIQERIVADAPHDVGELVELARAQIANGTIADGTATFERAIALATATAARTHAPRDLRMVAYAHLYDGRALATRGDAAGARHEFETVVATAARLPAGDARHDMYLEEGQEATVALGLAAHGALSVSLAPWTGPDLPGSLAATTKYRLAVAGRANATVALRASGVPAGWVASFCSDRLCAPGRTSVAMPPSGVKVVEFQLVPPTATAKAPHVRVTAGDGTSESTATT